MPVPTSAAAPASANPTTSPDVVVRDLAASMRPATDTLASSELVLAARPTAAFMLRHHQESWEVDSEGLDGPTWLPVIGLLPIVPGTNGIRTVPKGGRREEAFREAVSKAETYEGWTHLDPARVIPTACLPAGAQPGGYLRHMPARHLRTGEGGTMFLEVWHVPVTTPPGRPQRFAFDRAAYNRWRAWLVESGQVKAMPEYIPGERKAKVLDRIDRAGRATDLPEDMRRSAVERRAQELQRIENAQMPSADDAAPEPTSVPSRKKATP